MQMSERVAASADGLLFAKDLLWAIAVVKADRVQEEPLYKPCAKGDKCFCGYQWAFLVNGFVTFLFECKLWNDDTVYIWKVVF